MSAFLCVSSIAFALTEEKKLGPLHVTVYAPDWSWQSGAVNVLVTIENTSTQSTSCDFELKLPEGLVNHFAVEEGALTTSVEIGPGETTRAAFTNIVPLTGQQLQTYPLQIVAVSADTRVAFDYPLQTIRGPIVSGAKWAMFLPAILCGLWCITFVIALRRFAKPGAWREPADLSTDGSVQHSWMDETP